MKTDKRIKKVKIWTGIIVGCLALSILCVLAFSAYIFKIGFTDKQDGIYYFSADYDENIFDDKVYISKNRSIKFDHFGTGVYISGDNYKTSSAEARFFYDYFQVVINGDYEGYKDYFTESFFYKHTIPEKFTMQKIYDIEISALSSEIVDSVVYETYKVGYRIYENNGTFRADVASDELKPIAITITKGAEIKISAIVPIHAETKW